MARCSYLITYREGGEGYRRANLFAVLAWLAAMPELEVILVEQDDAPRLEGPLPHPACQAIFAFNPGPFNKSWGFNVAFRHASAPVLAFGDADVLARRESFGQALDACFQTYAATKPYRRIVDLDPNETAQVYRGNFDFLPQRPAGAPQNREGAGEHIVFCGGLFLIRRDAFLHLGGWDERFRGWGGEDDAMSWKLERARMSAVEFDAFPALHLWHPRGATFDQPHYADNRALLAEYRDYSDTQLTRFSEVQRQIIGHREKYRPFTP